MPEKYQGRKVYKHNPTVTLMRTTKEELVTVAKKIAEKLNQATGPTILVYPLKVFPQLTLKDRSLRTQKPARHC